MAVKKKTVKRKKPVKDGSSGLGIAALAAATAAGVYFLYGSKGAAKNRKKVKGWMLKARGEVVEKMEKCKNVDKKDYEAIVDTVAKKYKKLKTVNTKEMSDLAQELKGQWSHISNETKKKPAKKKKK